MRLRHLSFGFRCAVLALAIVCSVGFRGAAFAADEGAAAGARGGAALGPGLLERVARAHGLDGFDDVEAIRYTFRVSVGERSAAREWIWEPGTDHVSYRPADSDAPWTRYARADLGVGAPDSLREIDAAFINDQYWLLMPLHLAWDDFASVEVDSQRVEPPGGGAPARRIVVRYPKSGGYTPGDAYEVFVDAADRMVAWIYHPGGGDDARAVCRWTDHRRVGPLTIAMDHPGVDGRFRVWFTGVAVKVRGSGEWVTPR